MMALVLLVWWIGWFLVLPGLFPGLDLGLDLPGHSFGLSVCDPGGFCFSGGRRAFSSVVPKFTFGFVSIVIAFAVMLVSHLGALCRCRWSSRVGSSVSVLPFRQFPWIIFLALWGVGEAQTPGPDFTVGVANLNGLHNKAFSFADSTVNTWILSETHLTKGELPRSGRTSSKPVLPTPPSSMDVLLLSVLTLLKLDNGLVLVSCQCSLPGGSRIPGLPRPTTPADLCALVSVLIMFGFQVSPCMGPPLAIPM